MQEQNVVVVCNKIGFNAVVYIRIVPMIFVTLCLSSPVWISLF